MGLNFLFSSSFKLVINGGWNIGNLGTLLGFKGRFLTSSIFGFPYLGFGKFFLWVGQTFHSEEKLLKKLLLGFFD